MTGLPEYRNGGLLIDFGFIKLKPEAVLKSLGMPETEQLPPLPAEHPACVEMRALTVIELDRIAAALRTTLNAPDLTLAQVLEGATWKGGREIAKAKRSDGGSPIALKLDGTIF